MTLALAGARAPARRRLALTATGLALGGSPASWCGPTGHLEARDLLVLASSIAGSPILLSPHVCDTLFARDADTAAPFLREVGRLSREADQMTVQPSIARAYAAVGAAVGLATLYCLVFLVPLRFFGGGQLGDVLTTLKEPSDWVRRLVGLLVDYVGVQPSSRSAFHFGAYLLLTAGVIPWLILFMLRRGRPYDLGCRWPNRYGWRVLVVGYLVAVPFLVWMVRGSRFAGPYLAHLESWGGLVFCAYYLANMLAEHFLFHGAFLAAFRVGHCWPGPPPTDAHATAPHRRLLQWLGLAQPAEGTGGLTRVTRWLGIEAGCVPAICASAALFGLVHAGKDSRELLLSLPGGVALAYIAYRTNSWLTPFALHLATAGTACAMIVWAS